MNAASSRHLLVVQAARRLVEEKQARARRERPRKLDALQRPERKARDAPASDGARPTYSRICRCRARPRRACEPTRTFSRTVIVGKSSTF